jgi:hypothetical protein
VKLLIFGGGFFILLAERGVVPKEGLRMVVKWIDAFCSDRFVTIVLNRYTPERRELPQAGLPQGSLLSLVLFLFFNANLVQRKIDAKGGPTALIDDYLSWVTGPTAEANRAGLQAVIGTKH